MSATKTIQLRAYERVQVLKVKEYVDSHLHEVLTAEDLCLRGDISLYKLKAGFLLFFQKSFAKYVKEKRMEKAKTLLLTTNKIVYDIARDCGYQNEAGFYRAFKNYYEQSPDAFRKQDPSP